MSEQSTKQTKEAGGAPLLATLPPAPDWVEQISGAFQDDPAFEEVIALGRAFRLAGPFPEPPDEGA